MWGAQRFILNATYVEQTLKDLAYAKGPINHAILREDFKECLELNKMDISKKLAPDTVSRLMSLLRIFYGNRTEIETASV